MKIKNFDELPIRDKLEEKIRIFFRTIWKEKDEEKLLENWLSNFTDENEKIQMLYLLSKFMYFGNLEIRQILKSIYRDLFKYPLIEKIRHDNNDTTDTQIIELALQFEIKSTKFLGVGNPSESGVHMLYYFRQENNLPKTDFIYVSDIFKGNEVKEKDRTSIEYSINDTKIKRYVFLDDFCGSGSQVKKYLLKDLELLKKLNPNAEINYLMMFGSKVGIENLLKLTFKNSDEVDLPIFNSVETIFVLDDSYTAFGNSTRYFENCPIDIDKKGCEITNYKYGINLPYGPLGYNDCQLLISFFHNTPDNSLPIFWCDKSWKPIFKRYDKKYN